MRTNSPITIYNKYLVARVETFARVQIVNVAWEQRHARSQFDSADLATVYIPFARGTDYLKPHVWQALTDKSTNWTLQIGDVIVKGLINNELTNAFTLSSLKATYDDVLVITSVDTYDYGSFNMRHWAIGAK
jgi:hypothetical protein